MGRGEGGRYSWHDRRKRRGKNNQPTIAKEGGEEEEEGKREREERYTENDIISLIYFSTFSIFSPAFLSRSTM